MLETDFRLNLGIDVHSRDRDAALKITVVEVNWDGRRIVKIKKSVVLEQTLLNNALPLGLSRLRRKIIKRSPSGNG